VRECSLRECTFTRKQEQVSQHSPCMLTLTMHKDIMVINECECYAQNWYVYIVSALTGFLDVC
jgi:hypothetical protein